MIERFRRIPFFLAVLCLLLIPTLASAQATIKVNDNINFKFGTLIQAWADSAEIAADPQGYANNLFLRRIRFLVGGQLTPTISFFYETDNPNLGKAPKALGSGFITQDAFLEWKPLGVSTATPVTVPADKTEGIYLLGSSRNATAGNYQVTLTAMNGALALRP